MDIIKMLNSLCEMLSENRWPLDSFKVEMPCEQYHIAKHDLLRWDTQGRQLKIDHDINRFTVRFRQYKFTITQEPILSPNFTFHGTD